LIENESDIVKFKEDVIALKHLLQIAVTELSNEIDVAEAVDRLTLRNDHLNHLHDVWMFAIFEQNDLSQDTSCFWE